MHLECCSVGVAGILRIEYHATVSRALRQLRSHGVWLQGLTPDYHQIARIAVDKTRPAIYTIVWRS